jgi:hypothetical protein
MIETDSLIWFFLGVCRPAMMLSQPPFFYLVGAEKGKLNRRGLRLAVLLTRMLK